MQPSKSSLADTGKAALAILRAVAAASDVFPPLKSASAGALHIGELIMKFSSNQTEWKQLGQHIQEATASILRHVGQAPQSSEQQMEPLEKLQRSMESITREIESLSRQHTMKRAWNYAKDPERISDLKAEFDDALSLFHFDTSLKTGLAVAKLVDKEHMAQLLSGVSNTIQNGIVSGVRRQMALQSLPYAEGASWSPHHACLEGTRAALLEEIWTWITATNEHGSTQIFWLCDVAGSGKSSIAHSIAQKCRVAGVLGSSFFFDREVAERNSPSKLFSTIARDLANLDERIADDMGRLLDHDVSLASAAQTRQFQDLICKAVSPYRLTPYIVIVIDALDEGANEETLRIMRDEIPRLNREIRLVITSRPEGPVTYHLSGVPHVQRSTIDTTGQANLQDIELYTRKRLREVASLKGLGIDWPSFDLLRRLVHTSEGLFIWVSLVCSYLSTVVDPSSVLESLLSGQTPTAIPLGNRIDEMYARVLDACDWHDEQFVTGYQLFMGSVIALKVPLSVECIQSLHRFATHLPAPVILGAVRPLLHRYTDVHCQITETAHLLQTEIGLCLPVV